MYALVGVIQTKEGCLGVEKAHNRRRVLLDAVVGRFQLLDLPLFRINLSPPKEEPVLDLQSSMLQNEYIEFIALELLLLAHQIPFVPGWPLRKPSL
jgi:hypothetical protein